MPSAPTVVRATTAFMVCALGLAACALATKDRAAAVAPSVTSVVGSRFVVPVELDRDGLLVSPPPATAKPAVTESEADAMFEAADAVQGPHAFAIFGLGLVSIARRVEQPTTTTSTTTTSTTAPPPPSTEPPTTAPPPPPTTTTTTPPPPTTTTTAPPTTTTSTTPIPADHPAGVVDVGDIEMAASGTTTTTVPASTLPTAAPPTTVAGLSPPSTTLPTYRSRLAWVGIVWGATETCPGSTTTVPSSSGTGSYVAIVIDAEAGHRVLAYRSGGSSPCTGASQTPAVTEPDELLSVPWQPVGPASTAVQIEVPACGHYYGWTQVPGAGGALDDQVVVSVPFDPSCGSTAPQSQAVDQVVPLGSGQALVGHAPVGPIQALQALPSD